MAALANIPVVNSLDPKIFRPGKEKKSFFCNTQHKAVSVTIWPLAVTEQPVMA